MTTGKVTSVTSKPVRAFSVTPQPSPPGTPVDFTAGVDADDFAVALAAYAKGSTVTVSGTAPACTGVTAS